MNRIRLAILLLLAALSGAACTGYEEDRYIGHSEGEDRVVATILYWPDGVPQSQIVENWERGDDPAPGEAPESLEIRYSDIEPLIEQRRLAYRYGLDIQGGKEYLLTYAFMVDIIKYDIQPAFIQYVENYDQIESLKQRLAEATEMLELGVQFNTVVEQFSDDAGTNEIGGRIADAKPDELFYPLTSTAFSMREDEWKASLDPAGEKPLASVFGFHIIKLHRLAEADDNLPPRASIAHILLKYDNIPETENFSIAYKEVRKRILYPRDRSNPPALILYHEPALLAQVAFGNKNWREGIKYLKGAKTVDPDNLLVDAKLADVYTQLGFIEEPIRILENAVQQIEQGKYRREYEILVPGFYLSLAKLHMFSGNRDKFEEYIRRTYETYSEAVREREFRDHEMWRDIQKYYRRLGLEPPQDPQMNHEQEPAVEGS